MLQDSSFDQMQPSNKRALSNKKFDPNSLDSSGVPKTKIFDQINPKNNQSQRSNKLGY
jgi:hypothetical protein